MDERAQRGFRIAGLDLDPRHVMARKRDDDDGLPRKRKRSGTTRGRNRVRAERATPEAEEAPAVSDASDAEAAPEAPVSPSRRRVDRISTAARRALDVSRERSARAGRLLTPALPHLALLTSPARPMTQPAIMSSELRVATYNVHRWAGINGRRRPDPARAGFVISELDADVIALQEALRPFDGDDPLVALAEALGMHLAFAVTREHRFGQLGNAILSRFPIASISVLDISHSRIERRGALAAQFTGEEGEPVGIVATHLSLVDRTRRRQVESLLDHPQLSAGPAVLLGDMNAWRRCKATRDLDDALDAHNNLDWPASFPSAAPVLSLDRVYARNATVLDVEAHDTPASRRASDHLPVVARIGLKRRAAAADDETPAEKPVSKAKPRKTRRRARAEA